MKNLCLYFQVHQPYRLKRYHFFDMGKDHFYFDDYLNRLVMQRVAANSYIPMNNLLLSLIKELGFKVKVSFSISGTAIEQFKEYAPEVLESFKELAKTGCVEFLAETYSHSLSSLKNINEFHRQVELHSDTINDLFGKRPIVFRNTELIYSDRIGELVREMGYKTMMTEGTRTVLGWKSPNYIYANPLVQDLKLMLRNYKLSDDIAFRFPNKSWSEFPLTADKYYNWLTNEKGDIINLFMDYETFGEHVKADTGVFQFMEALIRKVTSSNEVEMKTPSQISEECQPVALLHVPYPISWADEERDLTAWLGNELQDEAFSKLYSIADMVEELNDEAINRQWNALQASDHFYYMCTKWFSDGDVHNYFTPFDSPYEAFMNYMNIFSDFKREVELKLSEKKSQ